jgi:hypothetical protein
MIHNNQRDQAKNFSHLKKLKKDTVASKKGCSLFLKNLCDYYLITILRSLFNAETIFFLMSWSFCFLGIYYHPFFYSFMLIEVIVRVSVLKNVIFAIYKPRVQILITLFLFLIFIYYFTIIAIHFLGDDFPNPNDTKTLISAILRMIDQTFKVSNNSL